MIKKTHKCSSEKFRVAIYYFCSELHYRKKCTKLKNLVVTVIILKRTTIIFSYNIEYFKFPTIALAKADVILQTIPSPPPLLR